MQPSIKLIGCDVNNDELSHCDDKQTVRSADQAMIYKVSGNGGGVKVWEFCTRALGLSVVEVRYP